MQTATAETPKPAEAPKPQKPFPKEAPSLQPGNFAVAEDRRQDFVAEIPVGISLEQALSPGFWAHVAYQMTPLDSVQLRAEDGSWVAYAIVRRCERNYAQLVLDRVIDMERVGSVPATSEKHRVEWKTTTHRWCVIRNSDNAVLQSGMKAKEEAARWLLDYERNMER